MASIEIPYCLTLYGAASSSDPSENQKLKLNEQKSKAVKETA